MSPIHDQSYRRYEGTRRPVGHAWRVIAADGAHSAVRKSLGLAFEGSTYPETNLIVTVRFPFEDHLEGRDSAHELEHGGDGISVLTRRELSGH